MFMKKSFSKAPALTTLSLLSVLAMPFYVYANGYEVQAEFTGTPTLTSPQMTSWLL